MTSKEPIKLTEEEIKQLSDLNSQFQGIKYSLGEIESKIFELNIEKSNLYNIFKVIKTEEKSLALKLETKYGEGIISLEEGTFLAP